MCNSGENAKTALDGEAGCCSGGGVWTGSAEGQATLIVQDDGPGVPPELVPGLFERFVRGAGDRGGSFGLGLAIVKAVAESHGGTVAFEATDEGKGARFVVRIPQAGPAQADRHASAPGERGGLVRS